MTAYLREHPDDLDMRWLLNVAHMTLGTYPASVPPQYRIDPAVFTSAEDPGRFVDVAPEKGLGTIGHAGGAVIEDFDNDGLPDVVVSTVDACESLRYYHQERDGTFHRLPSRVGVGNWALGVARAPDLGISCVRVNRPEVMVAARFTRRFDSSRIVVNCLGEVQD